MSRCIERVRSHPARPRTHGLASLHSNAGLTHDAGAGLLGWRPGARRHGWSRARPPRVPAVPRAKCAREADAASRQSSKRATRTRAPSLAQAAIRAEPRAGRHPRGWRSHAASPAKSRRGAGPRWRGQVSSQVFALLRLLGDRARRFGPRKIARFAVRSRRRSAACGHRANAGARVVLSRGWPCVR